MFLSIILILFTCTYGDTMGNIQSIEALNGFPRRIEEANHINVFLCWKRGDVSLLIKMLYASGFKARINQNISQFLDHPIDAEFQINVVDTKCVSTEAILTKADNLGLLKAPFRWIVFGKLKDITNLDIYLRTDSELLILEEKQKIYTLTAIYKASRLAKSYSVHKIGTWYTENSVIGDYQPLKIFELRKNLHGIEFRTGFVFNFPSTYKEIVYEYRNTHLDGTPRFGLIIHDLLASMLNVRMKYIKQTQFGSLKPNSTQYDGIIGDIQSGEVIMGASPIFFLAERVSDLDYVAPNVPSYMSFIFKAPPLSYTSNIFSLPFDTYVWYSSLLLAGITWAVIYIIVVWEWKDEVFKIMVEKTPDATEPSVDNVAVLQLGVITQQGSNTELKSISGRIAMISSLIAFMFLCTAYSANIVALLQSSSNVINTLEDLLNSGMDLAIQDLVYSFQFFQNATVPVNKAIYEKKLLPKGNTYILSPTEGMSKVRNEFFAYHTEDIQAFKVVSDTFGEDEKCNIKSIKYADILMPWKAVHKNHSYKELIKVGLFRLMEVGFYHVERKRIFIAMPKCTNQVSTFLSAGLRDTYGAFLIFGLGVAVTILIFLIEMMIVRLKRHRFSTNDV